jgi:hypothetical protein
MHARLRSAFARERIADALLGVALDAVEPFASDYLSADEYERLCDLVQGPVDAATDDALATIARELVSLAEGDPELRRRLETAEHRRP